MVIRKIIWTMPDKVDEDFSIAILEEINSLRKSLDINNLCVGIAEQYVEEESPHYQMEVVIGTNEKPNNVPIRKLIATYEATNNGKTSSGEMKISLSAACSLVAATILICNLFGDYDKALKEYYPEWVTTYINIDIS